MDSTRTAKIVYDLLVTFSQHYCRELSLDPDPGHRTRPWALGTLAGVAYHYTGGPSFERSARWFNDATRGNTVSSCHVLIDDGVHDDRLGAMWRGEAGLLRTIFPAPLVMLCPWDRGAWATNWANGRCLGVELRNRGYVPPGDRDASLTAQVSGGRMVERYTAEQLASALQIGRLACALAPDTWSDDYVLGHSAVSWAKRDPGPDFPIHAMRRAIQGDSIDGALPSWLAEWPSGSDLRATQQDSQTQHDSQTTDARGAKTGSGWTKDLRRVMQWPGAADALAEQSRADALVDALFLCGYNVDDMGGNDQARTRRAVAMFQRCYNEGHADAPLVVDGICGPQTWRHLSRRAQEGHVGERYRSSDGREPTA